MDLLKKIGVWTVTVLLWLWAVLPRAIDWVGRTTLPDDWEQLMAEKLPAWAAWLFSTPWWVPALLALLLTGWMIWISAPRRQKASFASGQVVTSGDLAPPENSGNGVSIGADTRKFFPDAKKSFTNEEVRISNLHTDTNPSLDSYIFDQCLIRGPAMLLISGGQFLGKTRVLDTEGDLENVLIEIPDERLKIGGVIQLNNCTFRDCTFRWVGFIGPKSHVDTLRSFFKISK